MEKISIPSPSDDISNQGHLAENEDSNSRIQTFVAPALLTPSSVPDSHDLGDLADIIDGKSKLTIATPSVSQKFLVERAQEGDEYAMYLMCLRSLNMVINRVRFAQSNIAEFNPDDAVEEDDLMHAAWLEVPKVIERFDSSGNSELNFFMGNRISGALYDHYRTFNSQLGLPRSRYADIIVAAKQDNPNSAVQKLIDDGFTDATRFIDDGELTLRDVSLDAELANDDELPASLIDFNSPEQQIASSKTYVDLQSLMDQLPDRERYVIASNYGFTIEGTKTHAEIGEVFGLTESRISQIHTLALHHLRLLIAGEEIGIKPQEHPKLAKLPTQVSGNVLKKSIEILNRLEQTPLYDNDVDNVLAVVPNWSLKGRHYEELDKVTVLERITDRDDPDKSRVSGTRKYLNITAADLEELIKSEMSTQTAKSGAHEASELDLTDIIKHGD